MEENVDQLSGLTSAEVHQRRNQWGYNEIPVSRSRNVFALLFSIVKEPMFLLLISAAIIYFLLGERGDAVILLISVVVVISITFLQEQRSERAVEALRDLSSPRAEVIRDNHKQRVAGRDLVPGDLIILSEGDRVPADGSLVRSNGLTVDESILTGESLPRVKVAEEQTEHGKIFSGTMVVAGSGIAIVTDTGSNTEMGKIGKSLSRVISEKSLLELEVAAIVKRFAAAGIFLCALIVFLLAKNTGQWLPAFLTGITLSIALLPEEFPVVITLFQAIGAFRLSKENVLTRSPRAIRTMGAVTVLCTDKTGTITMNQMQLQAVSTDDLFSEIKKGEQLPEAFHRIVEYGILASKKEPFDPMEKALLESSRYAIDPSHFHNDWRFIQEYGLSGKLLSVSNVWKPANSPDFIVAAKGAPEAIAGLCHLSPQQFELLEKRITRLSEKGLRVIGVAEARFPDVPLPADQHEFAFNFIGLLGFYDPVRPGVNEAIDTCFRAGVRVIMITGDHAGTAANIAERIGLRTERIITGDELNRMSAGEIKEAVRACNVFARTIPQHKLMLVQALKEQGEVVAMTGDGVNDAPALKAAHIGIAMGSRGSDVAREASDLVLLDDNFNTIVKGIRSGRRIFDNMQKALSFVFAVHIPIAGITLASVLFGWPLVLFPVHVVFLELIIDPASSIAFEAEKEEEDLMLRKPYGLTENLFNRKVVINAFYQGIIALSAVLVVFYFSLKKGDYENESRALAFTTLLLMNIFLILVNRSKKLFISRLNQMSAVLKLIIFTSLAILFLTLFVHPVSEMFKFSRYHHSDIALLSVVILIAVILFEAGKKIRRLKA